MGKKALGITWLPALAVCWFFFSIIGRASAQSNSLRETEEVVGSLSSWVDLKALKGEPIAIVTPSATRIQWWEKQWNTKILFIDGQEAAKFDLSIGTTPDAFKSDFSKDGKHFFIQAFQKKNVSILLDGKTLASGKAADFSYARFSPAGELVYAQRNGKKWDLMVNGERRWSAECDQVRSFIWTPSGKVAAFEIQGKGRSWVVNGALGPPFDDVYPVSFSGDGRFAYVGVNNHVGMFSYNITGYLIVDGKQKVENSPHDNFKEQGVWETWSLSSLHGWAKAIGLGDPAFSPDGKHLGYSTSVAPKQTAVVIDDVQGPTFFSIIYGPFFTVDGNHFAYLALTEDGRKLAQVYDHKIVHEINLEGFDHLGRLAKSSDLSRFAAALARRGNILTGRGPEMHPPFKILVDEHDEGKKEYEELSQMAFSPNARHFVYYAIEKSKGGTRAHVVVDGKPGKAYEAIIPDSVAFIDENTLRYAARDGQKFFRVTVSVE